MELGFPLGHRQASVPCLPSMFGCQGNQIPLTVACLGEKRVPEGTEFSVPLPSLVMLTSPSNPNAVSPPPKGRTVSSLL